MDGFLPTSRRKTKKNMFDDIMKHELVCCHGDKVETSNGVGDQIQRRPKDLKEFHFVKASTNNQY